MAQTGYTPILIYSSSTTTNAPSASNLTNSTLGSELAINIADGKLFYKDSGGSVQVIAWKTTPTTAGGTGLTSWTAGDLPYYATGTTLSKLGIGTNGYFLTSSGSAPQWSDPTGVAVTSISFGTTGLTPATATKGAVTVAGTLATTNGGTGLTSFTANGIVYASSTSALATGSALTFDGTNFATTGSATATRFIPSGSTVPTNGLYLPAANSVGLATNSTAAFLIDSSQNITVGTTALTTAKLNISSASIPLYVYQSGQTALQTYSNVAGFRLTSYQSTAGSPYTKTTDFVASGDGTVGSQIRIFTTAAGGSPAQVMNIFGSGGVSIGNTTDPGATNLSVTGTGKFGTTVGVGAATPASSGAGITFPATQSASSDANTLDDYEEGTWTPVVAETSVGGTVATGTFTGSYTKIGRLVIVNATLIDINTTGMTAGNTLYLRGLPFAASIGHIGSTMMRSVTYTGQIVPRTLDTLSYLYFYQYSSAGAVTPLTIGGISSGVSDIWFTVTYEV